MTKEEYITSTGMDKDGVWATEVEIFAAARLLETDIYTFIKYNDRWKWVRYPQSGILSSAVNQEKRAIYLVNTGGVHYDVVLEIEDNESVHDSSVIENRLKGDCVNEQSEEFSGVQRKILKSRDILFEEERNQMSMQGSVKRADICLMEGSNLMLVQGSMGVTEDKYKCWENKGFVMKRSVGIASDSTKKMLREQIRKRQFRKEEESPIRELQHRFWNKIMEGPTYVCFYCEQLWYKESVRWVSLVRFSGNTSNCEQEEDIDKEGWGCRTCVKYIKEGRVPLLSRDNNMKMHEVPQELKLHRLEERLVALRTPFMQLRELPRGGQFSIKGNVVNVPSDVVTTIKTLPMRLEESQIIPVKFKRKLSYKTAVFTENVRPRSVVVAARWLIENSQLYRDEGVTLDQKWSEELEKMDNDFKEFVAPVEVISDRNNTNSNKVSAFGVDEEFVSGEENCGNDKSEDDEWTETNNCNEESVAGILDTLFVPEVDNVINTVYCYAPSENSSSMGLFQDVNSEILAFPTLFCGQRRSIPRERVHYSMICKWELRHKDRRFAKNVANIFYKVKKLQIQHIQQKVTLSLRKKKKTEGKQLTAKLFKSMESIEKLLSLDEGYRVFKDLRGSPPYWERSKKELNICSLHRTSGGGTVGAGGLAPQ